MYPEKSAAALSSRAEVNFEQGASARGSANEGAAMGADNETPKTIEISSRMFISYLRSFGTHAHQLFGVSAACFCALIRLKASGESHFAGPAIVPMSQPSLATRIVVGRPRTLPSCFSVEKILAVLSA